MKFWSSAWDGRDRWPLRVGVAVIAAASQGVEAFHVAWQSQDVTRYAPSGALSRGLADAPWAAWALFGFVVMGCVGVARDRRPVASALLVLLSSAVLSEWQTQIFGSPSRNAFFPGAVVLGWTLGQVWALNLRPDRSFRERLAEAGALGCLAAAYVGSAMSKLLATGVSWADGAQVRALVLEQQPLLRWAWVLDVRGAIIDSHDVAVMVSLATLLIEAGAVALLFGRRLRFIWSLLLLVLHASIAVLNTMPYVGASLLLLLFCVPWRRPAAEENAAPRFPAQVGVLLACIVVAAWALSGWGWTATG